MAIVKVLVHKCLQKIEGYIPPGTKCGCRKWISIPKAMIMVEEGDAAYVITEMRISEVDEPCRLCGGLPGFQKYCGECRASGTVKVRKLFTVTGVVLSNKFTSKLPMLVLTSTTVADAVPVTISADANNAEAKNL